MDDDLMHLKMKHMDNLIGDNEMVATASAVKQRIRMLAESGLAEQLPKRVRGAAIGRLNQYLGGDDIRKVALSWLFAGDFEVVKQRSSKTLSNAEMWAITEWIDWWQDEDGSWQVGERFPREAICVLNVAIRAYNTAARHEKIKVAKELTESLVASMVELGGKVTEASKESEKLADEMSKIDKKINKSQKTKGE